MKKNIFILTTTIVIFVLFVVFLRSSLVSSSESNEAKPSIKKYDPKSVNSEHVEGEIIVKLKKGVSSISEKKALISSIGGESFKNLDSSGHVRIRLRDGDTVEDALKRYAEDDNVEYLEPNFIVRLASPPNDTYYAPCLWGLKNTSQEIISTGPGENCPSPPSDPAYSSNNPGFANRDMNIEALWDSHTDCSSIVVAVIDTGINYDHVDLKNNMWDGSSPYTKHGWNFVSNNNETNDTYGHGTHVAGIIGAEGDNGIGVSGVCWSASLMALKAFNNNLALVSDIISALAFAAEKNVDIINMSLQTSNNITALTETIATVEAKGILIVVAAGNGDGNTGDPGKNVDTDGKVYPCSYTNSNILCVTALDQKYSLPSFANWGSTSVDVGAPGTNVYSTAKSTDPNGYVLMNGTSMATPYAAGLAALIMSYHRNAVGGFGMTGIHAKDVIMRSGRIVSSLSGKTTTGKAIDATNILDYIATPYGVTGTVQ
jgi:thermitase